MRAAYGGDNTLTCSVCDRPGNQAGCKHSGDWHASYNDCGARCVVGLGYSNLGRQHWSCCYSTDRDSWCAKARHIYETPQAALTTATSHFERSDCVRHQVNLDEAPEHRWTKVVEAHLDRLPRVLKVIEDVIGDGWTASAASMLFAGALKAGCFYYGKEIEGIARVINVPVGKIALMQIAYEVFAACTSIVCDVDTSGCSTPYHIRTMDWPMPELEDLTIEVDFVRAGRVVCRATTWPGYVGILTGVKPGVFSASVNYRRTRLGADNMIKGVINNMLQGLGSSWPVSFLVREVLESVTSFSEAVGALQQSDLMAPTYITVAGAKACEGVVITRSRSGHVKLPLWDMACKGSIVQTNHDWFLQHPEIAATVSSSEIGTEHNICHSHEREAFGRLALQSMGKEACPRDLWLLCSTEPVRAEDTVYTVSLHPASGTLITRKTVLEEHERMGRARWRKTAKAAERALHSVAPGQGYM
eukprot:TRINITY_DN18562_c0_g1_i2.p1 TRINITY_DN18562_c0_g1~~TRINITY_DN18562_c0_g1_i2.p1  ORF type:complete len:473 (+),score=65.17 TRINITY_DN18562_c0_g1_i2:135-1553(+)